MLCGLKIMNDQEDIKNTEQFTADNVEKSDNGLAGATDSLSEEIDELRDKLLRSAAEYENAKRRYEKQIEDTKIYSVTNFAKDLTSVMDNLSRALEHIPADCDEVTKNFIMGVEMTRTELTDVFSKHGIQVVSPIIGDKFDYNLHHAILQIPTADHPQGTILQIMQVGYKINDRLLRPATVAVTKAL